MRRATVNDTEAILEEDWQAGGFNVYLRRLLVGRGARGAGELIVPGRGSGYTIVEELKPEHRPAPSMFLPEDALEALAAAAAGVAPAVPAHVEALADARAHRDRLLALVEVGLLSDGVSGDDVANLERLRALR